MAPLDAKWFAGQDDLPELIAENLEVGSLGQPVNAVLGRNGWDGRAVAGIGLELASDNKSVTQGQFFLRGPISEEPGTFQASRLWEKAGKDVTVTMIFPHGGEFDFSGGSLASAYMSGEDIQMSLEKNEQQIPVADWPRFGIKPFSLRLVAYLDKMSNKTGPRIKFTLLFYPATQEEMEERADAAQGPAWPGVKILEGFADLFPRAPEGGWGSPIYPILCPGTKFRQLPNLPSGQELRFVMGRIMGTARLPVPCANCGTMLKKWIKIEEDPEQYEERLPSVVWPAAAELPARTGRKE
jgi:hypothetical protein